jgi:hypothetical protein
MKESIVHVDRRRKMGEANVECVRARADWEKNFPRLQQLIDRVTSGRN